MYRFFGLWSLSLAMTLPSMGQDGGIGKSDRYPAAQGPKNPKLLVLDKADSRFFADDSPRPALNVTVLVEDLGIRIPPCPPSPRYALAHVRAIHQECAQSRAYLQRELDQLFKDQAADLSRMRAQIELRAVGTDKALFERLSRLAKAQRLSEAEAQFVESTKRLRSDRLAASEKTRGDSETMSRLLLSGPSDEITFGKTMENTRVLEQQLQALDDQLFLDTYAPRLEAFRKEVDSYVHDVAEALDASEPGLSMPSLVLARTCKIRILSTYLLLTKLNFQVWTAAAAIASQEPNRSQASVDASHSGIIWTQPW